ncbi:hypothetical protein BGX31_011255 [Mortierella sp. GBA43]|nr:hypothetical protein BGX31_011255 [Mortierella sp. GBA43]
MSAIEPFVCQESFHADNTTSCIRYNKVKRCIKEATEQNLNFFCVDHNSISIGGQGPTPLPTTVNMTVFLCSMDSCPTAAPEKEKKGGKNAAGRVAPDTTSKLTWSGIALLALVASQLLLF